MDASNLDEVIEQYHRALVELINRKPDLYKSLFSRREDVTLANPFAPFGPVSRGWDQVSTTLERAALNYNGGEAIGFDTIVKYVEGNLAFTVVLENFKARVGARDDTRPITARTTTIFRREGGEWRVAHRHTDTITAPRTAESILNE